MEKLVLWTLHRIVISELQYVGFLLRSPQSDTSLIPDVMYIVFTCVQGIITYRSHLCILFFTTFPFNFHHVKNCSPVSNLSPSLTQTHTHVAVSTVYHLATWPLCVFVSAQ